jgi:hypothetical protein
MRPSFFVRLGIAVCGTLFLWLLSASIADAAPVSRRHARVTRPQYESRHAPRRVRARVRVDQEAGGRSLHYFLRSPRLISRHVNAWLERRRTSPLRDHDAAALQNSTLALGGEDDLLVLASLEPLGVLPSPQCRIPIKGAVTPRSPRGPPPVTCVA